MLILTRRPCEAVMIGDTVKVTVLGVKGNQVRLGIDAPHDVRVDREEIRQRRIREQLEEQAAAALGKAPTTLSLSGRRQSGTVDGNS